MEKVCSGREDSESLHPSIQLVVVLLEAVLKTGSVAISRVRVRLIGIGRGKVGVFVIDVGHWWMDQWRER
jgi:hypothetical protein